MDNTTINTTPQIAGTELSHTKKRVPKLKRSLFLRPKFDEIPEIFKQELKFAVWKSADRGNGKKDKIPYNPSTGGMAKVNDPSTFGTFEEAKKAFMSGGYRGIGCLIERNSKIVAIDVDDCIESGQPSKKAKDIIDTLDTYTEKSVGGKGVHCLCYTDHPISFERSRTDGIEIYTDKRFLTLSAHRITDREPRECSSEIKEVYKKYFPPAKGKADPSIPRAICDSPLFKGDISGFPSPSEADLDLCCLIYRSGFQGENDIERIFEQSELNRDKWRTRPGYRERTIQKAIELEISRASSSRNSEVKIEILDTGKMLSTEPEPTKWLIKNVIPEGQVGQMIGDGKIGKSSLLLLMSAAVASGIEIPPFTSNVPEKVLIVNAEDPEDILHRRLLDLTRAYADLDKNKLTENLKIVNGFGRIGPLMRKSITDTPVLTDYGLALSKLINEESPALVILDTKSRLYGLDENNNDHATAWLFELEKIAQANNCSVIVAHHTGKTGHRSRGASAFDNNTRFRITLSSMEKKETEKYKIPDEDCNNYFSASIESNYTGKSSILYFKRLKGGVPKYMDFEKDRLKSATEMLFVLLKQVPPSSSVTRQTLLRSPKEEVKKIRNILKDNHGVTTNDLIRILRYLEVEGKISFEKTSRGKGKIILIS